METTPWLRVDAARARLMRRDTAEILTRLFYLERSLILSQAAWLPAVEQLEAKALLARALWEDAEAGNRLRERVFELRYPSRVIAPDHHKAPLAVFDAARDAPGPEAFLAGLARALLPALHAAYESFCAQADSLTDGPSAYLLGHVLADKARQAMECARLADEVLAARPERRGEAEEWAGTLARRIAALGVSLLDVPPDMPADAAPLPQARPFSLAVVPGRDPRFPRVRFYWPHIYDPAWPSAEGVPLQMRSAIGHLNEVWAAEICAANLYNFADELGWDFVRELARWTYDESRHCLMGYQRLREWGFAPEDLPLGDYIYVAARQAGPIYGLGMIFYFETRYIHRGRERIQTFRANEDAVSQHDYEFDWADETFHAEYGKRWLTELFKRGSDGPRDLHAIREACAALVDAAVATATEEEKASMTARARALLARAEARAAGE